MYTDTCIHLSYVYIYMCGILHVLLCCILRLELESVRNEVQAKLDSFIRDNIDCVGVDGASAGSCAASTHAISAQHESFEGA